MIPPKTIFIGTALTSSGRRALIGTNGATNTITDAETRDVLVSWHGAEVTACGTIGGKIICAATEGTIFMVDEGGVDKIVHADKKAWFDAVAPTGPTTGLLGGNTGRLFQLDISERRLVPSTLSEFGIERPGRNVLRISVSSTTIVTGTKELVLLWSSGKCTALTGRSRRETFYYGAMILDDVVWISGMDGPLPVLAQLPVSGGGPIYHPLPLSGARTALIASFKGQILLLSSSIIVGWPDNWKEYRLDDPNTAIAVFPDEESNSVLVVGYDGVSRRLSVPR